MDCAYGCSFVYHSKKELDEHFIKEHGHFRCPVKYCHLMFSSPACRELCMHLGKVHFKVICTNTKCNKLFSFDEKYKRDACIETCTKN